MGRPEINRLKQIGRAAMVARDERVLAAGQHTAFGVAAIAGVLTLGAPLVEHLRLPRHAPIVELADMTIQPARAAVSDGSAALTTFAPIAAAGVRASSVVVQSGAFASPFVDRAPRAAPVVPDASFDTPSPQPDVAQVLASEPGALHLDLAMSVPAGLHARRNQAHYRSLLRAPPSRSAISSLEVAAEHLVGDWRPSLTRDLSVFVAADDEALSWSFSQASPNHSRLVYRDNRVEVGEHAAGVAMSLNDMDLALAVIDKEQGSNLGYSANERYLGVLWTYRR